jgi:RecA/RadA recombinase
MNDIFSTLLKETGNEYAAIADEGVEAGDVTGLISTGSYSLNALLSGSIYGGLPANKVTALAGEPSTGKTFYALNICKQFLIDNPKGFIFYFESESAISKQMLEDRGVDTKRLAIMPVATIQEFRTQAVKILDKYIEGKGEKLPMLFVLDSLGNLSTEKEMQDIADGKDTRDMTRAQLIRGAFRVLTLKLGKAKVALIVTNHVYDVTGCALKGTMIRTVNGPKDIANIKIGDSVETLVGFKNVTNTFVYDSNEYYEIELDNGSTFRLTGEHKLMTQDGEWKKVSDLTEKDVVINIGH